MKCEFTYKGTTYPYRIVRNRRKRVAIVVTAAGEIEVRIPLELPFDEGQRFVFQKRKWIVEHQRKMRKKMSCYPKPSSHNFLEGDVFYYRGSPCTLVLREQPNSTRVRIEKCRDTIVISGMPLTTMQRKEVIEEWFRRLAKLRFEERCRYYALKLQVHYQTIRIKNQKSRWGSCSSKQNLNFNWKLIMAQDKALDYVVIHELCHLKEMNHSSRFWKYVESLMPDYKEQEAWLKSHQETTLKYE